MASYSPTKHTECKDIRSANLVYKRDKEYNQKWRLGARPLAGVKYSVWDENMDDFDRVRPKKPWPSEPKSHANRTPKPSMRAGHTSQRGIFLRVDRKANAIIDANDHKQTPLSQSLISILPQHENNHDASVSTASDAGILYSYDSIASPGQRGRQIDLGGLVDVAEKKWLSEQTDRIVAEYEILDGQGETTVLGKKKGKKNPTQKALVPTVDEEDDFEFV